MVDSNQHGQPPVRAILNNNMAVFQRPDSKYFYLCLEGHGKRKAIRERTAVLATPENRPLAERIYRERMAQLAETQHFAPRRLKQPRQDTAGWCYVYFVSDGAAIKIGRAVDVVARLRALQVSHPQPLELLATWLSHRSIEGLLHRRFHTSRLKGEWFQPTPDLLTLIDGIKAGRDVVSNLVNPFPSCSRSDTKVA
jgi:hypothetical protein